MTAVATINGKPLLTPKKQPVAVPTQALANAIAAEWQAGKKYSPAHMPLTSITYTAIDQVAPQQALIVESLMTYVDTDALSYRATSSERLATSQLGQWNPVLDRLGQRFDIKWQVTSGVMPIDQSPELHKIVQKRLASLDAMQLAAACVLASSLSSLALTLAVLERHMTAEEAFRLSRLEEDFQAEQWGHDDEAEARAARLQQEIIAAGRFLDLLEAS